MAFFPSLPVPPNALHPLTPRCPNFSITVEHVHLVYNRHNSLLMGVEAD
jgi:hypothetical protein